MAAKGHSSPYRCISWLGTSLWRRTFAWRFGARREGSGRDTKQTKARLSRRAAVGRYSCVKYFDNHLGVYNLYSYKFRLYTACRLQTLRCIVKSNVGIHHLSLTKRRPPRSTQIRARAKKVCASSLHTSPVRAG